MYLIATRSGGEIKGHHSTRLLQHMNKRMAGDELKIQILRKSMSTFGAWLDGCDKLLASIPFELERCNGPELRELGLKYKVCGKLPPSSLFLLPPSLLSLPPPSPPPIDMYRKDHVTYSFAAMFPDLPRP